MTFVRSVSFIIKNVSAWFENFGIWPFSRNTSGDEIFKAAFVLFGKSNELSLLTMLSVGLTTSSVEQVSS